MARTIVNADLLYGLCGAGLIGMSLLVLVAVPHLLRKLLAFNVLASGIFLVLVGLGQRGEGANPVPQALVLTGIVVAFASTAVALALLRRWFELTGHVSFEEAEDSDERGGD